MVSYQQPDTKVLLETPTHTAVGVPAITSILNTTDEVAVLALTNGSTTTFKARPFIPVTPFLCQFISECICDKDGDAMSVLLAVLVEIKNFDTIHATDTEFLDKANQKCKELLYWLYLVAKGDMSIPSIPTKPSSSHESRSSKPLQMKLLRRCQFIFHEHQLYQSR